MKKILFTALSTVLATTALADQGCNVDGQDVPFTMAHNTGPVSEGIAPLFDGVQAEFSVVWNGYYLRIVQAGKVVSESTSVNTADLTADIDAHHIVCHVGVAGLPERTHCTTPIIDENPCRPQPQVTAAEEDDQPSICPPGTHQIERPGLVEGHDSCVPD